MRDDLIRGHSSVTQCSGVGWGVWISIRKANVISITRGGGCLTEMVKQFYDPRPPSDTGIINRNVIH